MKTISETAHAHNVQQFEQLTAMLSAYEISFKSKKTLITNQVLEKLKADAKEATHIIDLLLTYYCSQLAKREDAYAAISNLADACIASVSSIPLPRILVRPCIALAQQLSDFEVISPDKLAYYTVEVKETGKNLLEIDKMNYKYSKAADDFFRLIQQLERIVALGEKGLSSQIAACKETHLHLLAVNKSLNETREKIIRARSGRSNILYASNMGIVDVAHDTKVYIKNSYGAHSNEWQKVSAIDFRRMK